MVNSSAHKMIRLLYQKRAGAWHLALMKSTKGVSKQVRLPVFDPTSAHPHRVHVREILSALLTADLEGGSIDECFRADKYEVLITIVPAKARKVPKEVAYAKGHDLTVEEARRALIQDADPETRAHHALFVDARERISTPEGSQRWFEECERRLTTKDGLYAGPPKGPQPISR